MFIVFSLTLMPYFYSCLMQWKTFLPFSKDHSNSHYSLISKSRHILCGKRNKAAQKVWPDIQAQAEHPTRRLSMKPNSWGFEGVQSSPEETEVFASQHCHSSMESLLDLKTQEGGRGSSSTLNKLPTPLVWHREVEVPTASFWDAMYIHNHRAIDASSRLMKRSDGSTLLEIC